MSLEIGVRPWFGPALDHFFYDGKKMVGMSFKTGMLIVGTQTAEPLEGEDLKRELARQREAMAKSHIRDRGDSKLVTEQSPWFQQFYLWGDVGHFTIQGLRPQKRGQRISRTVQGGRLDCRGGWG